MAMAVDRNQPTFGCAVLPVVGDHTLVRFVRREWLCVFVRCALELFAKRRVFREKNDDLTVLDVDGCISQESGEGAIES